MGKPFPNNNIRSDTPTVPKASTALKHVKRNSNKK